MHVMTKRPPHETPYWGVLPTELTAALPTLTRACTEIWGRYLQAHGLGASYSAGDDDDDNDARNKWNVKNVPLSYRGALQWLPNATGLRLEALRSMISTGDVKSGGGDMWRMVSIATAQCSIAATIQYINHTLPLQQTCTIATIQCSNHTMQ